MQLTVARILRAQGLRGEVAVDLRTDDPVVRLAPGAVLLATSGDRGSFTVAQSRSHRGRWFVQFEGVASREAAEALRGIELVIEADASTEADAWYPHELQGLQAELIDGTVVGTVVGLEHLPAQDVLLVEEAPGVRTMVPFVRAIVPRVDIRGGRVVLDPPGGLLARDAQGGDEQGADAQGAAS